MPFPHIERRVIVRRPALIVARHETGAIGALLWAMMITNALRSGWVGDIAIDDAEAKGLLIPSKIRTAKVSTVEESGAVAIGRLDPATWATVLAAMRASLGIG